MTNDNIGYIIFLLIASFVCGVLSVFTFVSARGKPGVTGYVWLMLASSIYALGYAFELAAGTLQEILFWLKIQYVAIPIIPVLCLIMCLGYSGYERYLKRNRLAALFLIPVITYVIYYTNDFHHLFYTSIALRTNEPFPIVWLGQGIWYWVHTCYSYLCIFSGLLVLIRRWHQSAFSYYRMQDVSMSIGLLIPLIGNFIYLTGHSSFGIDLAPVMISIASPFHAWALLSFRMFNLVPVARGKVFESMRDGVIVLDESNRIVDYNPAAIDVIPSLTPSIIGQSAKTVLEQFPDLSSQLVLDLDEFDIKVVNGNTLMHVHVRFSPLVKENGENMGTIVVLNNITERVMLYENLRVLATIDGLTQIYNRNHFLEESRKELERVKLQDGPISVIMMDIDHFKAVNDNYGHETGDIVIGQVAHYCKTSLRTGDIFGRYGGEEFVICLPFTKLEEAYELVEQLRVHIADQRVLSPDGDITVTASFGVAGRDRSSGDLDLSILLREADKALYKAKERGRNRVQRFDSA